MTVASLFPPPCRGGLGGGESCESYPHPSLPLARGQESTTSRSQLLNPKRSNSSFIFSLSAAGAASSSNFLSNATSHFTVTNLRPVRQPIARRAQIFADYAAHFVGIGNKVIQRAVFAEPFHRRFGAAFVHAGDVIHRIANQRQVIHNTVRVARRTWPARLLRPALRCSWY